MHDMEQMNTLERIALKAGKMPEQVYADIQAAIDAAWESESVETKELQMRLFPNGKPKPEEFIAVLASVVAEKLHPSLPCLCDILHRFAITICRQ